MKRRIIEINEEKCNGCGACANACHEGAIAMINGKAKLMRDDYCDGLGDCLPACPTNAISFVEREALAYNEEAVLANKKAKAHAHECGCPGGRTMTFERAEEPAPCVNGPVSQLKTWPVQIKLASVNAPYFNGASLLIAADCSAYAYGNFHSEFIRNKVCLIGCPKLDDTDYSEKLTEIIRNNDIKSVTIVRMAKKAIQNSGKFLPWSVVTISLDGRILG